ncbi:cAMP-dependent protein kinase catalytic subunit alpha-like [Anopheles ziemanni]|uniref:cAMP-dependent protein kinase catalytic subunit alpha-like n=1 Tax=Anopheles coustani TaxID=139045 RepID=UPI00265A655B|nr:cAMP-dependent protein kinase catalytic subunit alpha-like [Anopheles coustani]XP_058177661.1 cAMP-dependent protein kinase catalytic subunit alpha-like [Anopheles ziemanni]
MFATGSDYRQVLVRLKAEFERRYNDPKLASMTSPTEYELIRTLGSGAFGIVKLIKRKSSDDFFAMKILVKAKIVRYKQLQHTYNEKRILQSIRFPFVVSLKTSFKDNSYIYLVMPFVNGGEMFTLLRRHRKFAEAQAIFYAAQVAMALEYLHSCSLVYRDLKPENLLIDYRGYVKVTDFGFCKFIKDRAWTLCGTPEYLAPEIIQAKGYGKSVDWWSYGVLLFEMAAGYSPFYVHSADQMAMFERICKAKYKIPKNFSSELGHLVQQLLQTDLTRRYGNLRNGSEDIKQHGWFKSVNWIAMLNRELPAPYVPQLQGPGDASLFDVHDEQNLKVASKCEYAKEFADF